MPIFVMLDIHIFDVSCIKHVCPSGEYAKVDYIAGGAITTAFVRLPASKCYEIIQGAINERLRIEGSI